MCILDSTDQLSCQLAHIVQVCFGNDDSNMHNIWTREHFLNMSTNTHVLVDELDNPAGFIVLQHLYDTADIHVLCVHPKKQRHGIARALLNKTAVWALGCGVTRLLLEVRTDNTAAIALYTSYGFQKIHIRRNYYRLKENQFKDAIVMEKHLVVE